MDEEWRPVDGVESLYEVSNLGRVRSLDRMIPSRYGSYLHRGRIMKPGTIPSGHLFVQLSTGAAPRYLHRYIHRLVASAFIAPPPEGLVVCHFDGNPTNNHVSNLRWDTRSSNALDAVRHGVHANSQRTHCNHGHAFTPENTYLSREGWRSCRACTLEKQRRRRLAGGDN